MSNPSRHRPDSLHANERRDVASAAAVVTVGGGERSSRYSRRKRHQTSQKSQNPVYRTRLLAVNEFESAARGRWRRKQTIRTTRATTEFARASAAVTASQTAAAAGSTIPAQPCGEGGEGQCESIQDGVTASHTTIRRKKPEVAQYAHMPRLRQHPMAQVQVQRLTATLAAS